MTVKSEHLFIYWNSLFLLLGRQQVKCKTVELTSLHNS